MKNGQPNPLLKCEHEDFDEDDDASDGNAASQCTDSFSSSLIKTVSDCDTRMESSKPKKEQHRAKEIKLTTRLSRIEQLNAERVHNPIGTIDEDHHVRVPKSLHDGPSSRPVERIAGRDANVILEKGNLSLLMDVCEIESGKKRSSNKRLSFSPQNQRHTHVAKKQRQDLNKDATSKATKKTNAEVLRNLLDGRKKQPRRSDRK